MLSSRLRSREIDGGGQPFKRRCVRQRFSAFSKQEPVLDTHDPEVANLKLAFLRRRSKVVEIVAAGDVVFALTLSGVCAAFRGTKRIAFLNSSPDEVIRSLFYNKSNDSLVTVSVYRADNFSSLRCRNTPVEYIKRGKPAEGFALFESECLKWPGFVEFDDVNGKVLTYSAESKCYRVWEMTNYEPLFSVPDDDVTEIKISPGIMLLIHTRQGSSVPLKILSIEDGAVLKAFNHLLIRTKKVDFIEQFNEKLLVKQDGENLNIIDVHTGAVVSVDRTEFVTPSAFIFLYENNLFLTFRARQVTVWNFRGEQVTHFEDHELWHPETNTSNIFITAAQDYIVSFCRPQPQGAKRSGGVSGGSSADEDDETSSAAGSQAASAAATPATAPPPSLRLEHQQRPLPTSEMSFRGVPPTPAAGAIHVSHILTGRCVAKLADCSKGSDCAHANALRDVSSLHFSEERNELYVGDRYGQLHIYTQ